MNGHRDLRDFINQVRDLGELESIEGADWNLEIGAITELKGEREGPALLFDRIKGYPAGYRILSNLFCTPQEICPCPCPPTGASRCRASERMAQEVSGLPSPPNGGGGNRTAV